MADNLFDLEDSIPVETANGQPQRSVPLDGTLDLADSQPESVFEGRTNPPSMLEGIKSDPVVYGLAALNKAQEGVNFALSVIRWPFKRFIEHPVGVVTTDLQKGKFGTDTLKKAGKAFVPGKIPEAEYGSYGEIWRNYYKAARGLQGEDQSKVEPPDWYLAMASYGSAMGVETGATIGAGKLFDTALLRDANIEESKAIKAHFEPLKESLKKSGVKSKDLHPDGNVIALSDSSEIFLNKYVSAVLRGDKIRVPRWAKIKMPQAVVPKEPVVTEKTPAFLEKPDVFPTTGKEVILKPPKLPDQPKDNTARDSEGKPLEIKPDVARGTSKLVESATEKIDKQTMIERIRPQIEARGNASEIAKLNELSKKNALTLDEENALVSEISGEAMKPKAESPSIPEFTSEGGNTQTQAFGESIKGNKPAVQAFEEHIQAMQKEYKKLIKEDAEDTGINRDREKRMNFLNQQTSLANDALRVAKGTERAGDFVIPQPKTPEDLVALQKRSDQSKNPVEVEAIDKAIADFINKNVTKNQREIDKKHAEGMKGAGDSLIEEAKKHKTAEEFVKSQGKPLYHGTGTEFNKFDITKAGTLKTSDWGTKGIYFDPSKSGAEYYRNEAVGMLDEKSNEVYKKMENKAKEYGTTTMMAAINLGFDSPKYKEIDALREEWIKSLEEAQKDKLRGKVIEAYIDPKAKILKHYFEPGMITDQFLSDNAMEKGYDAVEIWNRDPSDGDKYLSEVIVMNPDVIRTKEQLNDIYNKAHGKLSSESGPKDIADTQAKYEGRDVAPAFYSKLEKTINEKMPNSAPVAQIKGLLASSGVKKEEMDWLGVDEFLQGKEKVTKDELLDFVRSNQVEVKEVERGEPKVNKQSQYALPEVLRASRDAGSTPEDLLDTIANDGDAYRALTKKFPELANDENWAEKVVKDVYGTFDKNVKFQEHQLPGGENYREMLLTLPKKSNTNFDEDRFAELGLKYEQLGTLSPHELTEYRKMKQLNQGGKLPVASFRSSHFDEPNILAHVRFNDRTGPNGEKILFLEEIQSDWHQKGRKQGYKGQFDIKQGITDAIKKASESNDVESVMLLKRLQILYEEGDSSITHGHNSDQDIINGLNHARQMGGGKTKLPDGDSIQNKSFESVDRAREYLGGMDKLQGISGAVPDAPFKKTWHELALKRMLRYAAENGYDKLAWTSGEIQAERYDLSKHLDTLEYEKREDGNYFIYAWKGSNEVLRKDVSERELADTIGKDLAEKIIRGEGQSTGRDERKGFSGLDLKVGGEGMKGFYDQMVPSFLNKYGKKWGAAVGETEISTGPKTYALYNKTTNNSVGGGYNLKDAQRIVKGNSNLRYELVENGEKKAPSIDITPAMKESVLTEGQPLFDPPKKYGKLKGKQLELKFEKDLSGGKKDLSPTERKATITTSQGGHPVFDSALSLKWKENGFVQIPNQKIESPADIAFAFKFLKDETVENFYLGAVKDGQIVSVELITIGTVNQATPHIFELLNLLDSTQADSYFLVHNHPSGQTMASREDKVYTDEVKSVLGKNGLQFKGHVIIDSENFGFIDDQGTEHQMTHQEYGSTKQIPVLKKYVEWHREKMGVPQVKSAKDIYEIAKGIKTGKDEGMVFVLDGQHRVLNAHILPTSQMTAGNIQTLAARGRGNSIILINSRMEPMHLNELKRNLINAQIRLLDDIDVMNGLNTFHSKSNSGILDADGKYKSGGVAEPPPSTPTETPPDEPTPPIKKISSGNLGEDTGEFFSSILAPISTRLKIINPKLKYALRKFEFASKQAIRIDEEASMPFLKGMQKIQGADKAKLDLALKNRDTAEIERIVTQYGLTQEYADVRDTLEGIFDRAQDAGFEPGHLEDYWPRRIINSKKFLKYLSERFDREQTLQISKALAEKEIQMGRRMNEDEKAQFINNWLRGYSQIQLAKPSNLKARTIDKIDEEMNQFYQSSESALVEYIYRLNDAIEARKFFGKYNANGADFNLDNSIGAYILDLLDQKAISVGDETQIKDILNARFKQKGTHGLMTFYKNMSYIQTMGSPISALTQIGDLAFSLYKSGYYKTAKALGQAIAGKSPITREDLGISQIAEEFKDQSKSSQALKKVFDLIGMTKMDSLGKETTINSSLERLQAGAKTPTPEFIKMMNTIFGTEAQSVVNDLKNGVISENVKLLLFNDLADVQPIALSEMPEKYLTSGNGRVFYMLKTYAVKQLDVYRNEVFLKMKDNPKEAFGNLLRLTLALMLTGMGADELKDLILNRPITLTDLVIDNIAKLAGFSKYTIYKTRNEGVTRAFLEQILPPSAGAFDAAVKDITKLVDPKQEGSFESTNYVPLVGKLYYWWFGKGREKIEQKTNSKRTF